jgi:ketosteroid isomerase-like protein
VRFREEEAVQNRREGRSPGALVQRLLDAVNDHDLESLVACFAFDYRNETPVHPVRGFEGREQVRRNWAQIFAGVPDLVAEARWIAVGDTVWSEWEMRGTRLDGMPHLMRGVVIFGVAGKEASWARFYLEPVEQGGPGIDEVVLRTVQGTGAARRDPAHTGPAAGRDQSHEEEHR